MRNVFNIRNRYRYAYRVLKRRVNELPNKHGYSELFTGHLARETILLISIIIILTPPHIVSKIPISNGFYIPIYIS